MKSVCRLVIVSMSVFTASDKLIDCFGNAYNIIKMLPSEFCGYHALSYCFTGNQLSYANIVDDCINDFTNIPELFHLRTNFCAQGSSTLSDCAALMRNVVQCVQWGLSVNNDAWWAGLSLLYHIAICTYSMENKEWHVFDEFARHGYICLLSLPGHFDVLDGINGTPTVPSSAQLHGISRNSLQSDTWQYLQSHYWFEFVHTFHKDFGRY